MPSSPLAVASVLLVAPLLLLAGMVQAWAWAIRRVRSGLPLLPGGKPRSVPWGFPTVLAVLFSWVAVNIAVSIGYLAWRGTRSTGDLSFTEQMFIVTLINGILLILIPALLRLLAGARLVDLGVHRGALGGQLRAGVVGFLLAAPAVYLVNGVASLIWRRRLHPLEQMVRNETSEGVVALVVLSAVVLAPAAEELIFRVVLQGWLSKVSEVERSRGIVVEEGANLGAHVNLRTEMLWLLPILITSAVFAFVHLPQWPAPLAIFLLSVVLGIVYERTGSFLSSFILHALFNGFGTALLYFTLLSGVEAPPKLEPVERSVMPEKVVPRNVAPRNQAIPQKRNSTSISVGAGPEGG